MGEPSPEAHVVVGVEVREEVPRDSGHGAVAEGVHDEWRVRDALVERAGPLRICCAGPWRWSMTGLIYKTTFTNELKNIF